MKTRAEPLVRVEGGGEIVLYIDESGVVRDVEYRLTEAPRFFEIIVKGLNYSLVPEIVSRVCGLCSVSYVLTAVKAFEKCLELEVPEGVESFRDLICLTERVKSHVIHVLLMNTPDLLGVDSFIELEKTNPTLFNRILLVVRNMNELVKNVIGRFSNVVNVKVGGVRSPPDKGFFEKTVRVVKGDLIPIYVDVAETILNYGSAQEPRRDIKRCTLVDEDYPVDGVTLDYGGARFGVDVFYEEIVRPVKGGEGYALYAANGEVYVVGPFARFNNYRQLLLNETKRFLEKHGWFRELNGIHQSFIARIAETLDALHRIALISEELMEASLGRGGEPRGFSKPLNCFYAAEAPRGVLYQRFRVGADGRVLEARIVTPTAQNLAFAESIARERTVGLKVGDALGEAKRIAVSIDPCISCSVHAIRVKAVRFVNNGGGFD